MLPTLQHASDIHPLLEEMKNTKYIGAVSLKEIEQHAHNGTIRFLYDGDQLAGFGAWQIVGNTWREIGPLYIMEVAREKGVARLMIDEMFAINADYNLYVVTKNPVIVYLARQYKFTQVSTMQLPKALKLHLLRRFTPSRVLHMVTKFSRDPVLHFIRMAQNKTSA